MGEQSLDQLVNVSMGNLRSDFVFQEPEVGFPYPTGDIEVKTGRLREPISRNLPYDT
jgi:hypothetical protein